jgi:hypothetical protein
MIVPFHLSMIIDPLTFLADGQNASDAFSMHYVQFDVEVFAKSPHFREGGGPGALEKLGFPPSPSRE